jgi:hypothetical protein
MTVPYSSPIAPLIGELKNVKIDLTTLANNDVIKFNQLENLWVNGVGGGGGSQDLCSVLTQGDDACDLNITNLNTLEFDPLTSITTTTPIGGEIVLSTNGSPALQISNVFSVNTVSTYTVKAPMFSPDNVLADTNVGNGVDGIYNQVLKRGTINQQPPFQQDFNNIHQFPQGIEREVAQSVYINSPNVIIGFGRQNFIIVPGSAYTPKFGNINGVFDEMYYDPCNMRAKVIGIEFQQALVPEPFRSNLSILGGHWISRFSLAGLFSAPTGNQLRVIVVQNRSNVFLRSFDLLLIEQDTVDVATTGVHRQLGWSNLGGEDIDNTRDTFYFELVNGGANDFRIKRAIFEFEYEVPH